MSHAESRDENALITAVERLAPSSARQHGRDLDEQWRVEVTTIGLLVLASQTEEKQHGNKQLDPSVRDDLLLLQAGVLHNRLCYLWPHLFPPTTPKPPVPMLRDWVALFDEHDLTRTDRDLVSALFAALAPMRGKQKMNAAWYTPEPVAHLMSRLLLDGAPQPWMASIHEPAVGTGVMLVSSLRQTQDALHRTVRHGTMSAMEAGRLLRRWVERIVAVDIDPVAAWCAASQIAVRTGYQPDVRVGDTLTSPDLHELPKVTHPFISTPDETQAAAWRAEHDDAQQTARLFQLLRAAIDLETAPETTP